MNLIEEITTALNEPNVALVQRIHAYLGEERTREIFQKALEAEAAGGMMTANGKHRRTPGGTFFRLVRDVIPDGRTRRYLFKEPADPSAISADGVLPPPKAPQPQNPPKKAPSWDHAMVTMKQMMSPNNNQKGEARTVKMTLIGRPKGFKKLESCYVIALTPKGAPALPKGLPAVPEGANVGTIIAFIASKQWEKVEPFLKKDTDDQLVLEGYPIFTPKEGGTALMVTNCVSIAQQRLEREAKSAAAKR